MQHPELAVVVDQSARVIHLGESVDLVGFAVAVGVKAADHAAAALLLAERALFVDADKQFPGRCRREADRVVHQRWLREHGKVEAVRRVDTWLVGFRGGVGAFL